jgi:hypothetical protein
MADPISWTVPLWVFDPINGSDSNTGADASNPIKTWSELLNRYKTRASITLRQKTVFQWLNSQPDSSDPIAFNPILVSAGGYQFAGVPKQVDSATITGVTPQDTSTGVPNQIATNETGAFWTPYIGFTVHDVTAGAQFVVESDLGNGQAQISAPKAYPITEFAADAPISSGDSLQIFSLPTIYPGLLDNINFGTVVGGGANLTQLNLSADFSFTVGSGLTINECTINNATVLARRTSDSQVGPVFTSCFFGVGGLGGAPFTGIGVIFGGAMHQSGNNFKNGSVLDGDVLCMQRIHTDGTVKIGRCYWGQTNTLDNPPTVYNLLNQNAGSARLWGPGGLGLVKGSQMLITGVTATNALLLKGPLTVDGASTAFPWVAGSHAFGAAVSVIPGLIDSNNGLLNPQTGSGYIFG